MLTIERKLLVGALIVGAATVYLAYLGATASWQYYLTVDECLEDIASLQGRRVRVSGLVAPDSLRITKNRDSARFALDGTSRQLDVTSQSPPPDNLREGIQVVVEGYLQPAGWLKAERIMTRCASKYAASEYPNPLATAPARVGNGP